MKYSEIENNSTLTPDELKGVNIPDPDGKAGAFSNYTFWQYTNVEAICKILGGSCFWVNNISGMNDLREADLHGAEKEDIVGTQSFELVLQKSEAVAHATVSLLDI